MKKDNKGIIGDATLRDRRGGKKEFKKEMKRTESDRKRDGRRKRIFKKIERDKKDNTEESTLRALLGGLFDHLLAVIGSSPSIALSSPIPQ